MDMGYAPAIRSGTRNVTATGNMRACGFGEPRPDRRSFPFDFRRDFVRPGSHGVLVPLEAFLLRVIEQRSWMYAGSLSSASMDFFSSVRMDSMSLASLSARSANLLLQAVHPILESGL